MQFTSHEIVTLKKVLMAENKIHCDCSLMDHKKIVNIHICSVQSEREKGKNAIRWEFIGLQKE